jgi:small subunit ribosomal protein S6
MPFYELVCISRARLNPNMLSDMLRLSATTIINGGGVVRGFQNLGEHDLPYRMKRHQVYHTRGR